MKPLRASCVMPTANRRLFVQQAIRYWLAQSYEQKELIIVDSSQTALFADLADGKPHAVGKRIAAGRVSDEAIVYRRVAVDSSVGTERNLGYELATGDVFLNWDDDDWYGPRWIETAVATLATGRHAICGIHTAFAYDLWACRGWEFKWLGDGLEQAIFGPTISCLRSVWERTPYRDLRIQEDAQFIRDHMAESLLAIEDFSHFIYVRHARNVTGKWHPLDEPGATQTIRGMLGASLDFYDGLAELLVNDTPSAPAPQPARPEASPRKPPSLRRRAWGSR